MANSGRKLTIDEGMALINSASIKYRFVNFDGIQVRVTDSLRTFRKGQDCVGCGAKGSHFRLKDDGHLRLFVRVNPNHCVQLTSDHIWPRSKGGGDGFWNRQPLCAKCNNTKSDKITFSLLWFLLRNIRHFTNDRFTKRVRRICKRGYYERLTF